MDGQGPGYKYDVALSFAGEQREYVDQVAKLLREAGVRVFYDHYEKSKLWGQDLVVRLEQTYRAEPQYVVVFVSADYARKAYPRHELRSALATAVAREEEYILPVRFDDTELPGLRSTISYIDAREHSPAELVDVILEKLGGANSLKQTPDDSTRRIPKPQPTTFNLHAAAEQALATLRQVLERRIAELQQAGYGAYCHERGGRLIFRVTHGNETVYSFDGWIGDDFGENTLLMYGVPGHPSTSGSNAHGRIQWDPERGRPVIKVFNLSLLPDSAREYVLEPEELAEAVWDAAVSHLRSRFRRE